MKNDLKSFYEFIEEHQNFYIDVVGKGVWDETSLESEKETDQSVKIITIHCNGLSVERFSEDLENVTNNAINYIRETNKEYGDNASVILETDIRKVRSCKADAFNDGENSIGVKVWIDENLKNSNFELSEDQKQFIDDCMKLQQKKIGLVLAAYVDQ